MSAANILIIEDDADIREGVRILLEGEDYAVTEAADGAAGLKLVAEDTDLVILDVMMPGMSGLKTCEELRKFSYVPVLFLTAKAQESDKLIGLMAGGDDYLAKPFSYSAGSRLCCAVTSSTAESWTAKRRSKTASWNPPGFESTGTSMRSI